VRSAAALATLLVGLARVSDVNNIGNDIIGHVVLALGQRGLGDSDERLLDIQSILRGSLEVLNGV